MTTTISEAGAHAAAAATDRIPAIKSPYDATGRGYTTPLQIVSGLAYVDVASATTTDIGAAASDKVRITGTTTITGLGTVTSGTRRSVRFAAALTLTHNATSLILPGAANITTAANDTAEFVSLGSGNWLCTEYSRADGLGQIAVSDLTALKTLVGRNANDQVSTVNRTSAGDHGGEDWRWDSSDTTTPDDVLTVRPDSISGVNPGRWKLNITGRAYTKLVPPGVAATDTAILQAAMAAGGYYEMKAYSSWLINGAMVPVSNTRLDMNQATIQVVNDTGGFNSTNRTNKFNANGDKTCLFQLGTGSNGGGIENFELANGIFTATTANERILQLLSAVDGFDTSQLRVRDILIRNIPCQGGGGFIAASSLGAGSAYFDNISAQDCTIAGTTWTGTPQITVVEIDSDVVGGTASKPGTIRAIRGRNVALTGSALSTYGNEADVVTLAGTVLTAKCGAWDVDGVFGLGVGEVVDCMANGARLTNIRGESVTNFVLKFVHGARYCVANNISGSGIGGALITFQGTSVASSGDTLQNVVSGATCEDFDTNEASAVLFAKNTGTVGVPKKNTVFGVRVLGDSNGDFYVKDNCDSDADNDNRVYLIDGSAAGTSTTSIIFADNTKVHAVNRAHTQISLGANQAVTTLATLDFSVATVDPEGIAVTGSDKVTVKWPGLYLVEIGLRFSTDLDDQDTVEIRVVGGGVTQVTRTTIAKSAEQDIVRASFHVLVKEQDIATATADIYAQCAVEGATDATVLATTQYTGMWITRLS